MNTQSINSVFGENAKSYFEISKSILDEVEGNKNKYFYTDNSVLENIVLEQKIEKSEIISYINHTIIMETLQRTYLATITGYLRQNSWIKATLSSIEAENYLMFCASIRGYLESSTDLYDALYNVPLTIANNYSMLKRSLEGNITDSLISPGKLEDILLHFQEASKHGVYSGGIYYPKSARQYMTNNHFKDLDLYSCYRELCEVTHPSSNSLDIFLSNDNNVFSIVEKDKEHIDIFLKKYREQFVSLFSMTDNLCLLILKILNNFEFDSIYSHSVDKIDMSAVSGWVKIDELIKKA